jgi:hypothetical protein
MKRAFLATMTTALLATMSSCEIPSGPSPAITHTESARTTPMYLDDCAESDVLTSPCVTYNGDEYIRVDRQQPLVTVRLQPCPYVSGGPVGELPCVWDRRLHGVWRDVGDGTGGEGRRYVVWSVVPQ